MEEETKGCIYRAECSMYNNHKNYPLRFKDNFKDQCDGLPMSEILEGGICPIADTRTDMVVGNLKKALKKEDDLNETGKRIDSLLEE